MMRDTFDINAMKFELGRDEGLRLTVYKDPGSGRAIGYGRNLDTQGISPAEMAQLGIPGNYLTQGISLSQAEGLLLNDITDRVHQLDVYAPWWRLLSPARQRVLINMAYEMGTRGMLNRMVGCVNRMQLGLWDEAAECMLATDWGKGKTHNRAARLAEQMRQG